jgi:hypothetical protein
VRFSLLSVLGRIRIYVFLPARPCQRCLKRGMADSCVEGQRKKAKYLLDVEELGKFFFA